MVVDYQRRPKPPSLLESSSGEKNIFADVRWVQIVSDQIDQGFVNCLTSTAGDWTNQMYGMDAGASETAGGESNVYIERCVSKSSYRNSRRFKKLLKNSRTN
jgi:hypothetical protein